MRCLAISSGVAEVEACFREVEPCLSEFMTVLLVSCSFGKVFKVFAMSLRICGF